MSTAAVQLQMWYHSDILMSTTPIYVKKCIFRKETVFYEKKMNIYERNYLFKKTAFNVQVAHHLQKHTTHIIGALRLL